MMLGMEILPGNTLNRHTLKQVLTTEVGNMDGIGSIADIIDAVTAGTVGKSPLARFLDVNGRILQTCTVVIVKHTAVKHTVTGLSRQRAAQQAGKEKTKRASKSNHD